MSTVRNVISQLPEWEMQCKNIYISNANLNFAPFDKNKQTETVFSPLLTTSSKNPNKCFIGDQKTKMKQQQNGHSRLYLVNTGYGDLHLVKNHSAVRYKGSTTQQADSLLKAHDESVTQAPAPPQCSGAQR